ncbi:MAG: DUF2007 domain-containing protein [Chitinophagaceae bacterium]
MELIAIRKFDNVFTANIMLSKLQDAGIECYIKDENSTLVTRAIASVKLLVKDKDEVEAKNLLDQFEKEYNNSITCPNCGGNNIRLTIPEGSGNSITGLLSSYFSQNTSAEEDMYKCSDCGYETRIPAGHSPPEPGE